MGKETLDINFKSIGLVTDIDLSDAPDGAVGNGSKNIDMNVDGYIQGIKKATIQDSSSSVTHSITQFPVWLIDNNGKYNLIHTNQSNIYAVTDFYGTPTWGVAPTGDNSGLFYTASTNRDEVYLGVGNGDDFPPKWVGYAKDQILAYINPVVENGTNKFIIDATESSAATTCNIYIGSKSTSTATTDFLENESSGDTDFTPPRLKISVPGVGTSLAVGNMVYVSVDFSSDVSGGGKIDGDVKVLAVPDANNVTVDIEFPPGGYQAIGFISTEATTQGKWKFNDGGGYGTAINIEVGKWEDIGNSGLKVKALTSAGWKGGDNWNIYPTVKTASPALTIENSELTNFGDSIDISVEWADSTGANFIGGKYYTFGHSVLYENEESPIHKYSPIQLGTDKTEATLTVSLDTSVTRSRRATGICIYGAVGDTESERGLFRLIKEIPFNIDHWDKVSGITLWTDMVVKNVIKTKADWHESYESRTGIVDNLESTMVHYSFSAVLNGSLFVADASRPELNTNLLLFRSEPSSFSTFNWPTNLLKIPKIPTAMVSFAGKIWIFTTNEIYKINYDLFIEDVVEGVGCSGRPNVVVTEYGMYWHDSNGVYHHDGSRINKLDEPINSTIKAISNVDSVTFCAQENQLLVHVDNDVYAYHIKKGMWMFQNVNDTNDALFYRAFSGKNGEVYITTYNSPTFYLKKLYSGTTDTAAVYTKIFSFGELGEKSKFYECNVDSNASLTTFTYYVDDRSQTSGTTVGGSSPYTLSKTKGKLLQLYFLVPATKIMYSASVIYRRFIGKYA